MSKRVKIYILILLRDSDLLPIDSLLSSFLIDWLGAELLLWELQLHGNNYFIDKNTNITFRNGEVRETWDEGRGVTDE